MPLLHLLPVLFIKLFGLINLFGIRPDLTLRHVVFILIGIAAFFAVKITKLNTKFLRLNTTFFYWIFIILLVIVHFVGLEVKGSQRWIYLFGIQFQPSEFFKVFFVIFLANILAKYQPYTQKNTIFLKTLAFTLIPFFLIFRQPDLGSAVVIFATFFVMVMLSPIPKKHILSFFTILVVLMPLIWFVLHDYQRDRITGFINPEGTESSTTYNITQAIIAIGSGTWFGRGLGHGKQSNLYFLPEYHTDFVFSSFVEQFGFVGGAILILLFIAFFIFLFLRILHFFNQKDEQGKFSYYYIVGFSAFILTQTCINIGMNLGMLPITGITLPFVSYGGSSLLTLLIALALIP